MPSRIAITLVLATMPLSASAVSAQTAKDEQLRHVISDLKACVRMHAAAARAIDIRRGDDAVHYFIGACSPQMSDLDPAIVGALPPGIIKRTIEREWIALAENLRPQ